MILVKHDICIFAITNRTQIVVAVVSDVFGNSSATYVDLTQRKKLNLFAPLICISANVNGLLSHESQTKNFWHANFIPINTTV